MPYILRERRGAIKIGDYPRTTGELNYAITCLCNEWIAKAAGPDYATINELVGVLECVKLELYRRVAAPYEDSRCAANGDVFPP